MKEISIEEKARRYDEAIYRVKHFLTVIGVSPDDEPVDVAKRMSEYIFPEFAESEDERIRKQIIYAIKELHVCDETKRECIAWLEKQGEHANFCNNIQIGNKVTRNEDGILVNLSQLNRVAKKQDEQKSVKVPKFKAGDFIQFNGMGHTRYTIKEVCGLSHYINTCNKRMDMSYTDANFELVEQKSAEWSEEDEKVLDNIFYILNQLKDTTPYKEDKTAKECIDKLKSLKDRYTWKPSEEQMVALKCAITTADEKWVCMNTKDLESLYEDLKKLK